MLWQSLPRPTFATLPAAANAVRLQCRLGNKMTGTGTNSLPLLLTVDETADLLRTTKKAIYSMVERGQIPGVTRIGTPSAFPE